jgi:ATP-dependent DNA ligase
MRKYTSFKYIYPPRPESVAPPQHLSKVEEEYVGQPKLNGSCAILATDGKEVHFMNRHHEKFRNKLLIGEKELKSLHRGKGWIYLVGEYLNKSQKDKLGKIFNGKFVIFDILVFEDNWLVGSTLEERQNLLREIFKTQDHDGWISKITEECFLVNNFRKNFLNVWKDITTIEMYEGMVFKKANSKLQVSFGEKNNTGWQLKIRKPTRNYQY